MAEQEKDGCFILWFNEINNKQVMQVGGKNASLGEMFRQLTPFGVNIPNGFAVTSDAYSYFLAATGLDDKINEIMNCLDKDDLEDLRKSGLQIRAAIIAAEFPTDLAESIRLSYARLCDLEKSDDVAVRSSATAEDLPQASFAGQQETYLNVQGSTQLLDACKRCFASLFTDRAISYRKDMGFEHTIVRLSIGVQKMVRSDLACSGVMFSIDTETGFRDAVLINASYGLGEFIVQGTVNPDEYYVFKPTLKQGYSPILQKTLGTKESKLVYDVGGTKMLKTLPVSPEDRGRLALRDDEILTLAKWACIIEEHYASLNGHPTPMDIEWAKDGRTGKLFIVQARPETVQSQRQMNVLETYTLKQRNSVLITGRSVGDKIANGKVRVIKDVHQLDLLKQGEVLVTDKTDPDWEPIMKRASAIITNRGGRTCHAAIVSRELGIPAIVGTENGTEVLKDDIDVTVSCGEGETGFVYSGLLPFEINRVNVAAMEKPKTKVMMNLGNPEEAFRLSAIPNDGVGLARMEFIISNWIKIHPMALLKPEEVKNSRDKAEIEKITKGYEDKSQYFIEKLAQGIAMIGAGFYPNDVIVRMSDFKTNEYAGLLGGEYFEPKEENPMLGFRGASRYYNERYREGFALECKAIKQVREVMGLSNVKVMIPFCRTVEEGRRVIAEMKTNGLVRGQNGLEVYVMCEIPSNVILADEFAQVFDGFSIGSNDLTQLILGVDRDSEVVAPIFDERNEAVKTMIQMVISKAKQNGRKIGICGQAPSDYPDFAQFLVQLGIDSISLNPDAVIRTTISIVEAERRLKARKSAWLRTKLI